MRKYTDMSLPSNFAESKRENAIINLEELGKKPELKFPVESLPHKMQEILTELEEKLNFPSEFSACSFLWAAGVAIGNSCSLQYKWEVKPNLFMVIVGRPGSNKSHPVEFAINPIRERDRDLYNEFEKSYAEYEAALAEAAKSKSNADLPSKPVLKKHIVSDSSMEAIKASMFNNPRGIGLWCDEIAGWLDSFKKYGCSTEQWLSIFSGMEIIHERKNSRPFRIPHPCTSVIGTMQTGILEDFAKGKKLKNGFLDRMLFVKPIQLERKGWRKSSDSIVSIEKWKNIIDRLMGLDLKLDEAGNIISHRLPLTAEAEEIIVEWQNQSIETDRTQLGEIADGISAKMEIYLLRFALIFQLLKWACGEGDKDAIDEESAENAIAFCAYFKSTAISVFEHVSKKYSVDRLSNIKSMIYCELYDNFYTRQGIAIAAMYGMPERTFKHWLATDDELFKRIGHGEYEKVYKSH